MSKGYGKRVAPPGWCIYREIPVFPLISFSGSRKRRRSKRFFVALLSTHHRKCKYIRDRAFEVEISFLRLSPFLIFDEAESYTWDSSSVSFLGTSSPFLSDEIFAKNFSMRKLRRSAKRRGTGSKQTFVVVFTRIFR